MPTIEEAVRTYLSTYPELATLVNDRIYPAYRHQEASLPAIVYQRISTARLLTHDQKPEDLSTPRFQFTIMATTYLEALTVKEALHNALTGKKGVIGGVRIDSALPALEQDGYDTNAGEYSLIVDYFIAYRKE